MDWIWPTCQLMAPPVWGQEDEEASARRLKGASQQVEGKPGGVVPRKAGQGKEACAMPDVE